MDAITMRGLLNMEERQAKRAHLMDDEDELFSQQIAATLRRLQSRQKALAKYQIQRIMSDIEFYEEQESY